MQRTAFFLFLLHTPCAFLPAMDGLDTDLSEPAVRAGVAPPVYQPLCTEDGDDVLVSGDCKVVIDPKTALVGKRRAKPSKGFLRTYKRLWREHPCATFVGHTLGLGIATAFGGLAAVYIFGNGAAAYALASGALLPVSLPPATLPTSATPSIEFSVPPACEAKIEALEAYWSTFSEGTGAFGDPATPDSSLCDEEIKAIEAQWGVPPRRFARGVAEDGVTLPSISDEMRKDMAEAHGRFCNADEDTHVGEFCARQGGCDAGREGMLRYLFRRLQEATC